MRLIPFVMYLDPEDPEDVEAIKYLKPKIKRRKVSGELRTAFLFYMRQRKRQSAEGTDLPDWEPEQDRPGNESGRSTRAFKSVEPVDTPKTVQEAAGRFLKRRLT